MRRSKLIDTLVSDPLPPTHHPIPLPEDLGIRDTHHRYVDADKRKDNRFSQAQLTLISRPVSLKVVQPFFCLKAWFADYRYARQKKKRSFTSFKEEQNGRRHNDQQFRYSR